VIDQTPLLGAAIGGVALACVLWGLSVTGAWALGAVLRVISGTENQDNIKRRGSDEE
jgi:outer membrane lipoprotein SlyB